jgi:hypothetical protein
MATPAFRDSTVRKAEAQYPFAGRAPDGHGLANEQRFCAYNQTRARILGVEVDCADLTVAYLDNHLEELTPKAGAGLWLLPFRGISPAGALIPLDLVYLDDDSTVIEVVESFPIFRASPSTPPAASVLVLPNRTAESTGTKRGDQLILCAPEEMKRRIHRSSVSDGVAQAVPNLPPVKGEPLRNAAPNLLQWEDRYRPRRFEEDQPKEVVSPTQPQIANVPVEPEAKEVKPRKSWLQRLLSPEAPQPRKASRESLPGLTAYFWTGGAPVAHNIQDVSPTGLYVVTDERWYPGTVIRMTLTDSSEPTAERSITVNAAAVRWGNDGVGLRFVVEDGKNQRRGEVSHVAGVDRKQLDQFFQRLRSAKSSN